MQHFCDFQESSLNSDIARCPTLTIVALAIGASVEQFPNHYFHPILAATISAVSPLLSLASVLALISGKIWSIPLLTAEMRGVQPDESVESIC